MKNRTQMIVQVSIVSYRCSTLAVMLMTSIAMICHGEERTSRASSTQAPSFCRQIEGATGHVARPGVQYDNQAWRLTNPLPVSAKSYTRSLDATDKIDLLNGKVMIYYNKNIWRVFKHKILVFNEVDNYGLMPKYWCSYDPPDGGAGISTERRQLSWDDLIKSEYHNVTDLKVVKVVKEKRVVNGVELLFYECTYASKPFGEYWIYISYHYTGKSGTVLIYADIKAKSIDYFRFRNDAEELLNGFQVQE